MTHRPMNPQADCMDFELLPQTPIWPAAGSVRVYADQASGQLKAIKSDGSAALAGGPGVHQLTVQVDGGGIIPVSGGRLVGTVVMAFAAAVTAWYVVAGDGTTTSTSFEIWKDPYTDFFNNPVLMNGTDPPQITNDIKNRNLGPLVNWTVTQLNVGDVVSVYLDTCTAATEVTLVLVLS